MRIYTSRPVAERMAAKTDRSAGPDGCWIWLGFKGKNGYGRVGVGSRRTNTKKSEFAHRAAWEAENGPIPSGMIVMHTCDNRSCVNPRHLRLGSQLDNMRDMIGKGRAVHAHTRPKLTCTQAQEIYFLLQEGAISAAEIAFRYGVSGGIVSCIARRKTWVKCVDSIREPDITPEETWRRYRAWREEVRREKGME